MPKNETADWTPFLEEHQVTRQEGDFYLDVTMAQVNCIETLYNFYSRQKELKPIMPNDTATREL